MNNKLKNDTILRNDKIFSHIDQIPKNIKENSTNYKISSGDNFKFPKTHKSFPLFIEV